MDNGIFRASNQINVIGREYHLSNENWEGVKEYSHDVRPFASSYSINNFDHDNDVLVKLFGERPSPDQILEIVRNKGLTYQRRDKEQSDNHATLRNFSPSSEMNIDLGGWLNNSKIWVPVTEVLKIPSQRAKSLNASM